MHRKGMSQVLSLIVAASVLMMTALTVIFMVQGGLGDFTTTINNQGCSGAVETKCTSVGGGSDVSTPPACLTDSGEEIQGAPQVVDGDTMDCNELLEDRN